MKNFEQLDVFIPDDPVSKETMKLLWNVFYAMLTDLTKKMENQDDKCWVPMMDYVPDFWVNIAQYYALQFYYEEKQEILYAVLVYVSQSDNKSNDMPIIFINVSGNKIMSMGLDDAAYTLMVAFTSHLGKTENMLKESIEHNNYEGS